MGDVGIDGIGHIGDKDTDDTGPFGPEAAGHVVGDVTQLVGDFADFISGTERDAGGFSLPGEDLGYGIDREMGLLGDVFEGYPFALHYYILNSHKYLHKKLQNIRFLLTSNYKLVKLH